MRFIFIIFSLFSVTMGNEYADWETITDMNEVQDIVFDGSVAWVATTGGIYSYDLSDSQITKYTNLDGLSSISNNAIELDDHGNVITGGETGILEFYSMETGLWRQLVVLADNTISDILYRNDTLWVAAGTGIAVFPWDGDEYFFKDYYRNFDIIPNRVTKIELFADRIWLGTDKGLLSAPTDINRYTLNDPVNWDVYGTADGLTNNFILDFEVIENDLWVGTKSGINVLNSQFIIDVETAWGMEPEDAVSSILKIDETIYIANNFERTNPTVRWYRLYTYTPGVGRTLIKSFSNNITCIKQNNENFPWAGIDDDGIYYIEKDDFFRLDGPGENAIRYIIEDSENNIWASSGKFKLTPNEGFFIFNGDSWTNIDFGGSGWSGLGNTDIIFEDPYNNIWLGTWGGGLMVFRNDEFEYFHSYNFPGYMEITRQNEYQRMEFDENTIIYQGFFSGIPDLSRYEVIGTIEMDLYGRLWISNYYAANDHLVAIAPYTTDGFLTLNQDDWYYFGKNKRIVSEEGQISAFGFDDFYRAWVGTFDNGIFVYDYQNKNDVTYLEQFTTQKNLYSNRILSIEKDQDGIMWIGTAAGLNSFDGVNMYRHVGDPEGLSGPLDNQINQIIVDDANNKWFATSGGLSILRGGRSAWDSTAWLGFTKKNSGLVDNVVNTVFVDHDESEVLIGTEHGISIYKGSFAEIREEYNDMASGPNPFIIRDGSNRFIITNLLYNSEVKIFTLNGQLIRKLNIHNANVDGGRAEWDGRDLNGSLVSSGVYLYFAYNENGKSKAGKIAVIRD